MPRRWILPGSSVFLAALGALLVSPPAPASSAPDAEVSPVEGAWVGALNVGNGQLRLVVRIERSADGTLTGHLDSPDQGAEGIPVEQVTFADQAVTAKVTAVRGTYQGKLSDDGRELRGTWTQGLPLPLILRRTALVPEPRRGWVPAAFAEELSTLEKALSEGAPAVEKNSLFAALATRSDDWLASPLSPATRYRLGAAADRLMKLAGSFPAQQRGSVYHLAATFQAAAGRNAPALAACREALKQPGRHDAVQYLLEEVEQRAGSRKRQDAVDTLVQSVRLRNHAPAASVAVVRDGQIVKSAGYGRIDLERETPAGPESVYELGSVTKQFTATAILMLAEEGKLKLDEPVSTYLTRLPAAPRAEMLQGIAFRVSSRLQL